MLSQRSVRIKMFIYIKMSKVAQVAEHIPTYFGRIHGTKDQCQQILEEIYSSPIIACYEAPDSGCKRSHCHYIASTDKYKNEKSLRNAIMNKCKIMLSETKQYQIKTWEKPLDAKCLQYICKDEVEPDETLPPQNIFMNSYGITEEQLRLYRIAFYADDLNKKRKENKEKKKDKQAFWGKIYDYITEHDPKLFDKCNDRTPHKIAGYVYDYFEENEKFLQNDRFIELTIKTIMIKAYSKKTLRQRLKRSMIDHWTMNFHQLDYFDYREDEDPNEDL